MKNLLLALVVGLCSLPVMAQEVPEPKAMFISGGVFCDTEIQLQTMLTGISLNDGEYPEDAVAGCGKFSPEQPVPMTVQPLYWYETPMVTSLIAEFVYLPNGWTQYGWIAFTPNPDWKPKGETF